MTDKDIAKLASRLAESLATKEDLKEVKVDIKSLEGNINKLEGKIDELEGKIDELDSKTDTILEFAEGVDETSMDHEKRLKKIEAIPVIAHQIKK